MNEGEKSRDCSIERLDEVLWENDRTVLLGAPGIGKSDRLDELQEQQGIGIVRYADDITDADPENPLVIDDFYELVSWYDNAEHDDRQEFKDNLRRRLNAERPTFVCTTPYRLEWILRERRTTFDKLIGDFSRWKVKQICVDKQDAGKFLKQELDDSVEWSDDHLRKTEWRYSLDKEFRGHLRDDESFDIIFEGPEEYSTYDPGMLVASKTIADLDKMLATQTSAIETIKEMLGDTVTGSAIEHGQGFLAGAVDFASILRDQGAFGTVKKNIISMIDSKGTKLLDKGVALGTAGAILSPPVTAVACIAFWAYATKKESRETRETIREEFQAIFSRDLLEISAATREDLEKSYGLAPKTLLHLNRVAGGVNWRKLDQMAYELEMTVDRIDELDATVERHEETLERLVNWILTTRRGPKVYQTLQEFESELYDRPEYLTPEYEVSTKTQQATAHRRSPIGPGGGQNALEGTLDILEQEDECIVIISGESGIGKSRLLLEVGRVLDHRGETDIWYVQNPPEVREPPLTKDTVLFLDEIGRMDNVENFLELAAESRREFGKNRTVQVVAAVRPVYEEDLNRRAIPDYVPWYNIRLDPLDESSTIKLLSDIEVSPPTARDIHTVTGGNPLLSRLLALAEWEQADVNRSPEAKMQQVIEETLLQESRNIQTNADAVESLLKVIAILGEYDLGTDADPVSDIFDLGMLGDQYRLLSRLSETGYVKPVQNEEGSGNTTYIHQVDIFAEYLRLQALSDDHGPDLFMYRRIIERCLANSAVSITRGLVELRRSSLARFEFFDCEKVAELTQRLFEEIASQVVETDLPMESVLRVQTYIGLIESDVIPHTELIERYDTGDPDVVVAKELFWLVSVLYRHVSDYDKAETIGPHEGPPAYTSPENSEEPREWLDRLETLATDHPDHDDVQINLAKTLVNAINAEGEAGQTGAVQARLETLDSLAADYPDHDDIQHRLGKAIPNAVKWIGAANRFEAIQTWLERLESLAADHPDSDDIQRNFAEALAIAIRIESSAHGPEYPGDQLKTIQKRLDRIESLAADCPDNDEIQRRFAKAILSAIRALLSGQTEYVRTRLESLETLNIGKPLISSDREVQTWLERLEKLAEDYPDQDDIQRNFARALATALRYEGAVGQTEAFQARLERLETLVEDYPDQDDIQRNYARALATALSYEVGQTEAVQARLECLETVPAKLPYALKRRLAEALGNGTNTDG